MMAFLAANGGTIIVGLLVFGIVAAIVTKMIKDRKNVKTSCGCGCEGCSHKCH